MILIDPPRWPHRGTLWSHLVSDVSHEELHDFAAGMDIPRRAFQGDHYDIPQEWYDRAVGLGAVPTDSRQLLRRIVAAGLRRGRHTRPAGRPEETSVTSRPRTHPTAP